MAHGSHLIRIFTPSFADEGDTNAQNLTVKEVVARLDPEQFEVMMIRDLNPDPRIAQRKNTTLLRYHPHGNTPRIFMRMLAFRPDVYFFPRYGPLDQVFLELRKYAFPRTALISYVVMMMNSETAKGMAARLIREADRVYSNSTYVSETINERFAVLPAAVYDGVDRRFFYPAVEPKPAARVPVALYAGSFQARKRVETVIELAATRPQMEFRLAGKGETESVCRALAQSRGCCNVVFLGHLTSSELGAQMRESDVFVFPSVLEGHPQVLIQAAACGLPSLAMSLYRPDIIVHGRTGFLADTDQQLAEKLDLLLADRQLRRSMSQAAAQHAQSFDWDRITRQWEEIFREAVLSKSNPGR